MPQKSDHPAVFCVQPLRQGEFDRACISRCSHFKIPNDIYVYQTTTAVLPCPDTALRMGLNQRDVQEIPAAIRYLVADLYPGTLGTRLQIYFLSARPLQIRFDIGAQRLLIGTD